MSNGKKRVGIIGGGSSGVYLMKELTELGHEPVCFELLPRVGGVYVKTYDCTMLTTSSLLTSWSDFSDGKEDNPVFWSADQYLEYLENFVQTYKLREFIKFNTAVEEVRKNPDTGKWDITYRMKRGSKAYRNCPAVEEDPNEPARMDSFDSIAICTGVNYWPCRPTFPGEETCSVEIVHSDDYRTPDRFAGKRVFIVGGGEAGSDIIQDISKVATKCCISIHGKHGHLIPRIQGSGRVTDLNTNRARYSNPYILGDWVGYMNQLVKYTLAWFGPRTDKNKILMKIGELNMAQKTSAFSKYGCKNEGMVTAVVTRGAEMHRDSWTLKGNKVVFQDGSEFEFDIIIACTGYTNCFPFLEKNHPELASVACAPRTLFKQCIYPGHNGEVVFLGYARPAFGSIPPCVEMQTRLWTLILNGEIPMPSMERMQEVIARDTCEWETRFAYDNKRVKGLVDFQVYCDGIAKEIGCMPPLYRLLFTQPYVFYKIMLGPFTMHQYRLVGPHAKPGRALQIYRKLPVGDLVETSITVTFLIFAKIMSMLGFKKFKPNEL